MATTTTARGQITIVDLNDAKQIQLLLEPSLGTSQIYNTESLAFVPNYASNNNIITPKIFITGSSTNYATSANVTNWQWTINGSSISGKGSIDATTKALKLTSNIGTSDNFWNIKATCNYFDPETSLTTSLQATLTIQKNSTAGSLLSLRLTCASGQVFRTEDADSKELTIAPNIFSGSTQIIADSQRVTVKWHKLDISTGTWTEITSTSADSYPYVKTETAGEKKVLHVRKEDVLNFQSFRCTVQDTKGTTTPVDDEMISEIITLQDLSDPFTVEVHSTTGDKIINGTGSTDIFARVYKGSILVEDENTAEANQKFTYKWIKYDATGARTNFKNSAGSTRTGAGVSTETVSGTTFNYLTTNRITLYAADVDTRATAFCEVTEK